MLVSLFRYFALCYKGVLFIDLITIWFFHLKTKWLSGKVKKTNARDGMQLKMKCTHYFTVIYMIMTKTLCIKTNERNTFILFSFQQYWFAYQQDNCQFRSSSIWRTKAGSLICRDQNLCTTAPKVGVRKSAHFCGQLN